MASGWFGIDPCAGGPVNNGEGVAVIKCDAQESVRSIWRCRLVLVLLDFGTVQVVCDEARLQDDIAAGSNSAEDVGPVDMVGRMYQTCTGPHRVSFLSKHVCTLYCKLV